MAHENAPGWLKRAQSRARIWVSLGSFTNCVDKILFGLDHLCMCVDKFFTLNMDKN